MQRMDEPALLRELDLQGYVVLPDFMPPPFLEAVRARVEELFALEGENAGSEFRREPHARRLANLVDKGSVFVELVSNPLILRLVAHVVGDDFKLSSLNARSTNPFAPEAQPLHVDMGVLPDQKGYAVCNSLWMLDDFTPDNGATRVVPGSHRSKQRPQDVLPDPLAPHPEEVLVLGKAGTVIVYNAHLWHGGTANRTGKPRRALHSFYIRGDLPQQQYQKRLLRPETQAGLTPELRRLLALDDPLNDQLCEKGSGQSGFMR